MSEKNKTAETKEEILQRYFNREATGYSYENCIEVPGVIQLTLKAALAAMEEYRTTTATAEPAPSVNQTAVQNLVLEAEKRVVGCILDDIEFGYSIKQIKNKIKAGSYVGNSIETFESSTAVFMVPYCLGCAPVSCANSKTPFPSSYYKCSNCGREYNQPEGSADTGNQPAEKKGSLQWVKTKIEATVNDLEYRQRGFDEESITFKIFGGQIYTLNKILKLFSESPIKEEATPQGQTAEEWTEEDDKVSDIATTYHGFGDREKGWIYEDGFIEGARWQRKQLEEGKASVPSDLKQKIEAELFEIENNLPYTHLANDNYEGRIAAYKQVLEWLEERGTPEGPVNQKGE